MIDKIKNLAIQKALNGIKDKLLNPYIDGIALVREIAFRDKKLFLILELDGLKDHPVEIIASEISIADDCSTVSVGKYESNMAFARNALNRFATMPFAIPEGASRMALSIAKKALGL